MNDSDPEGDTTPAPRIRPVVGGRSPARERALHLLYESALTDTDGPSVLATQIVAADHYAELLVGGVDSHLDEIDALITHLLPDGWVIGRLATLDRTILRLAIFELGHCPDVPTGVVLSEAVALAETYGTDESPRFVNGLLAAAAERTR